MVHRERPRRQHADLHEVRKALESCQSGSFGDGTGTWAKVQCVADTLWVDYGRAMHYLDRLAIRTEARPHPLNRSFWQAT